MRSVALLSTLVALQLAVASPSPAQEPAQGQDLDDQGEIEDPPRFTEQVSVTVTARKREENLQAVPFSVVAPTQQTLRNRGAESIEDEPRPRTEPDRDARRLRRPDRPRPAGCQGAGRGLPR
jgi:outer membrane receptor protein involved in Fe transport